jgi:hypothetical protein
MEGWGASTIPTNHGGVAGNDDGRVLGFRRLIRQELQLSRTAFASEIVHRRRHPSPLPACNTRCIYFHKGIFVHGPDVIDVI